MSKFRSIGATFFGSICLAIAGGMLLLEWGEPPEASSHLQQIDSVPRIESGNSIDVVSQDAMSGPQLLISPTNGEAETPALTPLPPALFPEYLHHSQFRGLAEVLENEPVDQAWATKVEANVFRAIASSEISILGGDVVCRTSVCRVELIFAEEYDLSSVLRNLVGPVTRGDLRLNKASGFHSDLPDHVELEEGIQEPDVHIGIIYFYAKSSLPSVPRETAPSNDNDRLVISINSIGPRRRQ